VKGPKIRNRERLPRAMEAGTDPQISGPATMRICDTGNSGHLWPHPSPMSGHREPSL
jgi:hypothetical protein